MPVRWRGVIAVPGAGLGGALNELTESGRLSGEPFSTPVVLGTGMAGAEISKVLVSGLFFMMFV